MFIANNVLMTEKITEEQSRIRYFFNKQHVDTFRFEKIPEKYLKISFRGEGANYRALNNFGPARFIGFAVQDQILQPKFQVFIKFAIGSLFLSMLGLSVLSFVVQLFRKILSLNRA